MLRRQLLGLLTAAAALPAADKPSSPAAALRCRVTAWMGDPPLDPASFKAAVEGRGAKIVAIRDPDSPLLLLIVLDLTGDLALISPAREALKSELQALPENVWVALLRAQDGLRVLADPGPGRADAIAQLDALETTGRAGLLETVEPAAALAERILRRSPVRTAVLFLTDSSIYNYREDYTNPVDQPQRLARPQPPLSRCPDPRKGGQARHSPQCLSTCRCSSSTWPCCATAELGLPDRPSADRRGHRRFGRLQPRAGRHSRRRRPDVKKNRQPLGGRSGVARRHAANLYRATHGRRAAKFSTGPDSHSPRGERNPNHDSLASSRHSVVPLVAACLFLILWIGSRREAHLGGRGSRAVRKALRRGRDARPDPRRRQNAALRSQLESSGLHPALPPPPPRSNAASAGRGSGARAGPYRAPVERYEGRPPGL